MFYILARIILVRTRSGVVVLAALARHGQWGCAVRLLPKVAARHAVVVGVWVGEWAGYG